MRKASFAFAAIFAIALISGLLSSQVSRITSAFTELCTEVNMLVPPVAMLLVIVSALTYGIGQLMGAEMRARSVMWSTTMMTGTIAGVLLMVLMPPVLSMILNTNVSCAAPSKCGGVVVPYGYECCDGSLLTPAQLSTGWWCCRSVDGQIEQKWNPTWVGWSCCTPAAYPHSLWSCAPAAPNCLDHSPWCA